MSRKIIITVDVFSPAQEARIREAAARYGLKAVFCHDNEEARREAAEGEILFGSSPELIAAMPDLRWICAPSAGLNQYLEPPELLPPGVLLSNSSGAYGVTIAEHIVMVTLEMLRRQAEYTDIIRRKCWQRDLPIRSIHGSRITLLGTGDIGQEAARRLRAFSPASLTGMNRSGRNPGALFDRCITERELDDVLPETDLLILSLPATPDTDQLLDARRMALLPEGALIVNVGRGNAIAQRALEEALRAGRLMAALDVMEREPIPPEDSLWSCPNLLLTPHCAGNMTLPWTVERIISLFLEDLENYAAGRPLHRQVTREKGY